MSQLRSQKLRKRYKSRTVVQDVSLEVSSGEVVGLLGPNGAGKTTCFYMIVGLIPVDAGAIHLDSASSRICRSTGALGISYLPQENSVFRRLTVEENVQAILELQGLASAKSSRASSSSKDLNIAHLRKHAAISFRVESDGAWRSRARSARARRSSCSTSLSPASTRSRCSTSSASLGSSRSAASACSQQTITCARRSASAIARTLSTRRRARRAIQEIVYNDSVRRVYLGENFRM